MLFPIQAISRKKQLISEAIAPASSGLIFLVDEAKMVWLIEKSDSIYHTYKELLTEYREVIEANRILFVYFFSCEDSEELDLLFDRAVSEYRPSLNLGRDDAPLADLGYSEGDYIDRYNELNQMVKMLKQELDELKPNIVSLLEDLDENTYEGEGYNIKLQKRPSYEYSPKTKALEKELKKIKKSEEKSGEAKVVSFAIFPVLKAS